MKKLIHKILKFRKGVTFIYGERMQTEQWIAFGKYTIHQSLKTV